MRTIPPAVPVPQKTRVYIHGADVDYDHYSGTHWLTVQTGMAEVLVFLTSATIKKLTTSLVAKGADDEPSAH